LDYNNTEVQTLQDEMEAVIYSEETIESESLEEKELIPNYPDKPSQILFPEEDGSLESLLLMLKVPPTQDVFQLIVQNAMGNDLQVSQKVFLSLENNGYTSNINFPSTAYNHLNNKANEDQYIANTTFPNNAKGILSSKNSNKIIIQNSNSTDQETNNFQNYQFGNDHEANANLYFPQCRSKEDRQRLQQYQKQKRRASCDFMDLVSQVPYWVNWDRIRKGQEVFWKYGLPLSISTTLYAMTKGAILPLPDPLNPSSRNFTFPKEKGKNKKKDESYRLLPSYLETSQIIIESMMADALRPGGVAWKSLIQIRCRHAQFRVDYVDSSYDLQELHDYLSDGIKYYEKKNNKKKNKEKENWQLDTDGNLHLISKSKPEPKSDVKVIEFVYPNNSQNQITNNSNQLLITGTDQASKKNKKYNKGKVDEDSLELEMMKNQTNVKNNNSKSKSNQLTDYYPTPTTSPIPNQRKTKKSNSTSKKSSNTNNQELPPLQKEVMVLPTELLDSIFPINQISLAKTILYLSIGSIKAMEKTFGIKMSKEEQNDYLLVWRYISWICGLEDRRGKNYGNKIITPKYAEIAINYFLEKDPLVSWDDELVYHAQAVINSLSLTIPVIGATEFMKSVVNEVSRKFTYFTSMPIPKEMGYSITITLPNNNTKVLSLSSFYHIIQWLFNSNRKIENESEYDSSFDNIKKQYFKTNNNFNHRFSKGKSKSVEESSTSISTSSQKYNKYKKKVNRNMEVIHGRKSYISSGIASIIIIFVRLLNNILGFTDIGIYFMNRTNQALLPKLIWIANNYQWVDFSRRKLNR